MKYFISLFLILCLCLIASNAYEDQNILVHMNSLKKSEKAKTKTSCGGDFRFLSTPFTRMFTFNSGNLQNTGPIAGIPTCGDISFVLGSVATKSNNKDHVNFLLGDIQQVNSWKTNPFTLWTWWDDNGITPALNFGSKLIAVTNSGEKDNFASFYGIWRFVMIPLKSDASFDIIPGGYSQGFNPDFIGFNLIAFV